MGLSSCSYIIPTLLCGIVVGISVSSSSPDQSVRLWEAQLRRESSVRAAFTKNLHSANAFSLGELIAAEENWDEPYSRTQTTVRTTINALVDQVQGLQRLETVVSEGSAALSFDAVVRSVSTTLFSVSSEPLSNFPVPSRGFSREAEPHLDPRNTFLDTALLQHFDRQPHVYSYTAPITRVLAYREVCRHIGAPNMQVYGGDVSMFLVAMDSDKDGGDQASECAVCTVDLSSGEVQPWVLGRMPRLPPGQPLSELALTARMLRSLRLVFAGSNAKYHNDDDHRLFNYAYRYGYGCT